MISISFRKSSAGFLAIAFGLTLRAQTPQDEVIIEKTEAPGSYIQGLIRQQNANSALFPGSRLPSRTNSANTKADDTGSLIDRSENSQYLQAVDTIRNAIKNTRDDNAHAADGNRIITVDVPEPKTSAGPIAETPLIAQSNAPTQTADKIVNGPVIGDHATVNGPVIGNGSTINGPAVSNGTNIYGPKIDGNAHVDHSQIATVINNGANKQEIAAELSKQHDLQKKEQIERELAEQKRKSTLLKLAQALTEDWAKDVELDGYRNVVVTVANDRFDAETKILTLEISARWEGRGDGIARQGRINAQLKQLENGRYREIKVLRYEKNDYLERVENLKMYSRAFQPR